MSDRAVDAAIAAYHVIAGYKEPEHTRVLEEYLATKDHLVCFTDRNASATDRVVALAMDQSIDQETKKQYLKTISYRPRKMTKNEGLEM